MDHVRAMAKRQKDRLEKEIQELQAELQELQDKHFDEVRQSNFLRRHFESRWRQ